jgi:hypothetical protein
LSKLDVLLQAGCDGQYVESPGMRFDEDPENTQGVEGGSRATGWVRCADGQRALVTVEQDLDLLGLLSWSGDPDDFAAA